MYGDMSALLWPVGSHSGTTGATDLDYLEGREVIVPNINYGSGINPPLTGLTGHESMRLKIVRNVSGVALLPGLLVTYKGTVPGGQVDGYTKVNPVLPAGVVDPYLPAAGVPANGLFYIVTEGLVLAKLSVTAAEAVVVAGNFLCTVTAAASTFSTTAGRFTPVVLTGATQTLADQILNAFGVAVSAATTADTGASRLVRLFKRL